MRLTFSLLWFDDNPEFLESLDLDPLKETIRSWGFVPTIEFVSSAQAFRNHSPFRQFDLIVVDFILGSHPDGQEFIKELRNHGIFTEVIFYSNVPSTELWEAIRTSQLEGVFVANRQGIADKIERVGHQAVHKILDLNNMRGIVMAEVGEIDLLLESILRTGIVGLEQHRQKEVYLGFHERASAQSEKHSGKLKEFGANPEIESLIALSDSAKRWMSFRSVLKHHSRLKGTKVGDYLKEVLEPRNFLAHGTPRSDGQGFIFSYHGKEYKFNDQIALNLRQTIMSFRDVFEAINEDLSAAKAGA